MPRNTSLRHLNFDSKSHLEARQQLTWIDSPIRKKARHFANLRLWALPITLLSPGRSHHSRGLAFLLGCRWRGACPEENDYRNFETDCGFQRVQPNHTEAIERLRVASNEPTLWFGRTFFRGPQ